VVARDGDGRGLAAPEKERGVAADERYVAVAHERDPEGVEGAGAGGVGEGGAGLREGPEAGLRGGGGGEAEREQGEA
jgi:hypothetical protein